MIELYKPDMYRKSIYDIDFKRVKSYGIKCLLFDLDNTLVPIYVKKPSRKIKDFIERLKDMGFKVIIMSNSGKKRLYPFKEKLGVDCSASSKKPFKKKFNKILKEYGYSEGEVAIIGDQLPMDIYGGNRVGIFTIFVDRISKKELIWTKFNRIRERRKIKKLTKKGLFIRGKYYD